MLIPLWAIKQVWVAVNRFNNGMKTLITMGATQLLPTVVARTYLPFAAVPGWAMWNYFKARKVMTECMCFALGPQMAVDCLDNILDDARSAHAPSRLGSLVGKQRSSMRSLPPELKQALVRACAISILTYSCMTPLPLINGDSSRPAHLRRHAGESPAIELYLYVRT